jgi:hypothetical protein
VERARIVVTAIRSAMCFMCCDIFTPPGAVKFEGPRPGQNYWPEIPETAPAVNVAGTAGDLLPRNQKLNLQPN